MQLALDLVEKAEVDRREEEKARDVSIQLYNSQMSNLFDAMMNKNEEFMEDIEYLVRNQTKIYTELGRLEYKGRNEAKMGSGGFRKLFLNVVNMIDHNQKEMQSEINEIKWAQQFFDIEINKSRSEYVSHYELASR
jgi:hypothetical protein